MPHAPKLKIFDQIAVIVLKFVETQFDFMPNIE